MQVGSNVNAAAGSTSNAPQIFETSDGRFFLISNGQEQQFQDGQFFQTPDGRLFRIDAMTKNELPPQVGPASQRLQQGSGEDESDDRLQLILNRIRNRVRNEEAKTERTAAPAPPPSPSPPPPPPSVAAVDPAPVQNVDAPSIFQTSDGRYFVISSTGRNQFSDDQYFQTPDGRLFKISKMDDKAAEDIVRSIGDETADDDSGVPDLISVLEDDIGEVDSFAVADAANAQRDDLPTYVKSPPAPFTQVTSSVSTVLSTSSTSSGPGPAASDAPAAVSVDSAADDEAVIISARDNNALAGNEVGSEAGDVSGTGTPVFVQSQPLFSSNQILGSGQPFIRSGDGSNGENSSSGDATSQQPRFILQASGLADLRSLLGLGKQQQQQQQQPRGLVLYDAAGNPYLLHIY